MIHFEAVADADEPRTAQQEQGDHQVRPLWALRHASPVVCHQCLDLALATGGVHTSSAHFARAFRVLNANLTLNDGA